MVHEWSVIVVAIGEDPYHPETKCLCGLCGSECERIPPDESDPHIDSFRIPRNTRARRMARRGDRYVGGLMNQAERSVRTT